MGRETHIRWWHDEEEFKEHARSLQPIGFKDETRTAAAKEAPAATPASRVDAETKEWQTAQPKRPVKRKRQEEPEANEHRVYVLQCDNGDSYVGYTPDIERRLRQHNGELAGGAACTAGRAWEIHAVYSGFKDKQQALCFEATMRANTVSHYSEWPAVADSIRSLNKFGNVQRIV